MKKSECVEFLQWALPRLRLRWPGFRKVRNQVCKRIAGRYQALGLPDVTAYRTYLETHPDEWPILDGLCHISISRFYRDRAVFDQLYQTVLPTLADIALAEEENELRCWSIGCASGEEPYSLNLIWHLALQARFPTLTCHILATDANEGLLQRAQAGYYAAGSLRDLPQAWRDKGFAQSGDEYCLRTEFRVGVEFQRQDIRSKYPPGPFHLILCRNLVLTYFEESLQIEVLGRILQRLHSAGVLIIGNMEHLPGDVTELAPWFPKLGIYQKRTYHLNNQR